MRTTFVLFASLATLIACTQAIQFSNSEAEQAGLSTNAKRGEILPETGNKEELERVALSDTNARSKVARSNASSASLTKRNEESQEEEEKEEETETATTQNKSTKSEADEESQDEESASKQSTTKEAEAKTEKKAAEEA